MVHVAPKHGVIKSDHVINVKKSIILELWHVAIMLLLMLLFNVKNKS
jgi:hypothetical protein